MLNTSKPSSSFKGDEVSKPVKKRQKSSKTSAKETGSKSTGRCEPLATSSAKNEVNAEGERWYELLEKKIGLDINAKKWMKEHPELAYKNKSELLIRLAYELCLAKNTEYDPENENEEQNNKYAKFDTKRIFALFEVANDLIEQSDRKNFVEFVCQKGNVQLLEMICKQEDKDVKGKSKAKMQYRWNETFTGYSKLIDLLQYVIDDRCSPEIVLCIAEKIYGRTHVLYNGKQYLDSNQAKTIKGLFNYQGSVIQECLKAVIKLGYKDVVSVMLSGDIYHCIRLMKWKVFQEKQEFCEAYNMIKETVADVISSWVEDKQFCKSYVQNLLDQGIEIDIKKMSNEDLVYQIEYLGKEVMDKTNITKKKLMEELKKLGQEKGEVRLRSIVVGSLISTLFFKHQDEAMKGESFTLKITKWEKNEKENELNELNKKINSGEPINDTVLELIKSLNSSSHFFCNWFFREVLAKVVNENLDTLQAVCTAICKEPMQELLKGEEVHENVIDVLQFFGVEVLPIQIAKSEIPSSCASIADHFMKDINVYSEKEAKGNCSSDELAFSGLTRKIIRDLEQKKDLTDKEDLISKAVSEIKKGINILADGTAASIDAKDIFLSFELINDKITKEKRKEIVELICQKGNVQLLEMICKREEKDAKGDNKKVERQYRWNGTFTGYSKLIDLLQYIIDDRCSPEIVLCIAEKMYGRAHVFCNGAQYLDSNQAKHMRGNFSYPGSVVKEFLKKTIKLGYKDAVSVMLSGDIYHCIRLMKWKVFQENQEFREAYNMIKETVADVISSWVKDKQSCKSYVQNLLDQEIETEMKRMKQEDLVYQLECLGKKATDKDSFTQEKLMKELKKLGKEKGEVRLRPTVLGALISTLFFKHQDKVMKGESFTLKTTLPEKSRKEKKLNELNQKISSEEPIKGTVLELIKSLNSSSHLSNNWFFREVLAKVVNENLDKLKAVCAAICKEPMEELLKGEEIHKNVIDVLQFFGVEKDFLLERSILENSDDALVRNSQGVEETLSNRSEKSISSSSRQSSADHDPQSSTVPISQGGKSIPSAASKKSCSASNLPSSRVAEKNNEGVMQNNCGQGGNPCYSINVGQGTYYPNIRNDFMGGRMHGSNQWEAILAGGSKRKIKKSSDDKLPKISYFKDAHYERYRKELLRRILDYNQLIDSLAIPEEGSDKKMGDLSLDSSLDISSILMDQSNISMDQSDLDDVIQDYVRGVEMLKKGQESVGKDKICEAAKQQLPHAVYAYSIIKFKEVMEGSTTNQQELIREAVKYMNNSGKYFFPLSSFVLGMMELHNIETYGSLIQSESGKSWKMHFADVLLATEGTNFRVGIEASKVLSCIGLSNPIFFKPTEYLNTMGEKKAIKELEWMLQYVKYELARDIVSNEKNSHTAQYLLRELSLSDFVDAKFLYAVALLSNELEEIKKEKKVCDLLESVSLEHQEAKLLLGILPFRKGYESVKSNYFDYLREYVNVTCDNKDLKKTRLKEKVSIFVAYEYINRYSPYVPYNEQEARNILKMNGYTLELDKLEKIIQERKALSKNVLPDVVETLKGVYSMFKQEDNSKSYIQQLLPVLKELYKELKGSKITIQQSERLSSILQQLKSVTFLKEEGFSLIQQLCYNLRKEVEKQSSSSFKEKMLPLIVDLDEGVFLIMKEQRKVNADVQKRRTYSFSSTSTTITRRYSTATTVPNRSEGVSSIFTCPSTPSSKVKRLSLTRTTSSPVLPSVIRAQSTRLDFETTLPGDDDVFSGCKLPFIVKCIYDNLDDPEFLNDIFNLAVDHCEKYEYDKALPLYRQVLEKREKWLKYNNFNIIMVHHNIALTLYGLKRFDEALEIFSEMLCKLGRDSYHAKAIKNNIKVILNQEDERYFMQLEEEQEQVRSHFSESASSHFQNTSTVDNDKGSCGSSLSSSSGFDSGLSTFLDRQSISKRGKSGSKLSNLSTRTEQEQSSGNSKQNVSEVTKSNKSSIGGVLCWDESTSESSQSFLRSRSVSGKLSATGMSSSRPSSSLDNLETEKHTAFSRSIGKR
ncbi:tetratricopeptide repeat protein [Wolbachia endosymbiont of Zygogramma bicolorata]|uniref:tetratricopeptide repeat protein n=1 Tax=Wolbachia endosymbiont of Zygogramma bicolorata TaxID=3134048 RepID=UPI003DA9B2A1